MKKLTQDEFINNAIKIHGNKFDYSLVEYINSQTKVKIICPIHGIFETTPNTHLRNHDCPKCYLEKRNNHNLTTKEFIEKSNIIYNNYFDYSLVEYINNKTKVKIICPIHGIFEQIPNSHLLKNGCKKCGTELTKSKTKKSKIIFEKNATRIHNNVYDYSLVEYTNNRTNIKIICKKCNIIFEQNPKNHLNGHGCPNCLDSNGEKTIINFLDKSDIKFIKQKKFDDCKNIKKLSFDFYLPNLNMCIEFDGRQHYESIKYFGGDNQLQLIQKRDKIKNEYCEKNNIKLLRIKYNENIEIKLNEFLNLI